MNCARRTMSSARGGEEVLAHDVSRRQNASHGRLTSLIGCCAPGASCTLGAPAEHLLECTERPKDLPRLPLDVRAERRAEQREVMPTAA